MKHLRFIFLILLFLVIYISISFSQTNVGGIISENTTWSVEGAPYIVVEDIIVNQGVSLIINPEVLVKFETGKLLKIDGELRARGNESSGIIFTSNNIIPEPGDWKYIYFTDLCAGSVIDTIGNYVSGSIMEYCRIEYAGSLGYGALRIEDSSPFLKHCIIIDNTASGIYADSCLSVPLNIQYCSFRNNCSEQGGGIYIINSDVSLYGNLFMENNTNGDGAGLYISSDSDISINILNNIIYKNTSVSGRGGGIYSVFTGNCSINNNSVIMNTALTGSAIYSIGSDTSASQIILNNAIVGNITDSATVFFENSSDYALIRNNNYFRNISEYELFNNTSGLSNIDAINNYWDSIPPGSIPSVIYDYTDNPSKSIVDYLPVLNLPDTAAPISPPDIYWERDTSGSVNIYWPFNRESDHSSYEIYFFDTGKYFWGNQRALPLGGDSIESYPTFDNSYSTFKDYYKIAITAKDNSTKMEGTYDMIQGHESWYTFLDTSNLLPLKISYEKSDVSIRGGNDGWIDLTVTGGYFPFEYTWSNGSQMQDISNILAGEYSVTVTDSFENSASVIININEPPCNLEIYYSKTNVSGYGGNDGSVNLTVTGGIMPYNYLWSNGETSQDIYNLYAGEYSVTVSDSAGCQAYDTISITQPTQPDDSVDYCILTGNIYAGDNKQQDGIVLLFNKTNTYCEPVQYTYINNGIYYFDKISKGDYFIYAIPNPLIEQDFYPTYFVNKLSWENADPVLIFGDTYSVDIYLTNKADVSAGAGVITGRVIYEYSGSYEKHIFEKNWFSTGYTEVDTNDNSVRNMPVFLLDENNIETDWTISNDSGCFKFDNVNYGTYNLSIQKAGFIKSNSPEVFLDRYNDLIDSVEIVLRLDDYILKTDKEINTGIIELFQVYPNPAEDIVYIRFKLNQNADYKASLYDLNGREMLLLNDHKIEGYYTIDIGINHLSRGIYFLRFEAGDFVRNFKVAIIK